MRDFIYIYFEMVKRIQNHFNIVDVKIVLLEDGDTTVYQYISHSGWEIIKSSDTLSEFINWIESLR